MNTIVLGLQAGDEGKARVVDEIAHKFDIVARFNGADNAGHTVWINGEKTVLHLIPCGILSGKECFIGSGVYVNPEIFAQEIELIKSKGIDPSLVKVSENCHLIMPYHIQKDIEREEQFKIGTTKRGVGPAAEDKFARRGIRLKDLFGSSYSLFKKLELRELQVNGDLGDLDEQYCDSLARNLVSKYSWIKSHMVAANYLESKKNILFEGAQSSLLDIDNEDYPFVTSSSCTSNYVGVGAGVNLLNTPVEVLGVFKAYVTKVGTGSYPTCIEQTEPSVAAHIRYVGKEFGATTGRPRQIGWLDLDSVKEVCKLNGVTSLALMKSDVLNGLPEVKVKINGELISFKGWNSIEDAQNFYEFVDTIEIATGIPIKMISYGPERGQTILT